jgi:hypothetical protein
MAALPRRKGWVTVMTALVVVAGILTGAFAGGCLALAATFAVVSRSQERMQRTVRYWQWEATRGSDHPDGIHPDSIHPDSAEPPPEVPTAPRREPWVW